MCVCFFFSSRRRHTRWTGDWSSDVCSSDLPHREREPLVEELARHAAAHEAESGEPDALRHEVSLLLARAQRCARGIIILSALSVSEKRATLTSTRPAVGP